MQESAQSYQKLPKAGLIQLLLDRDQQIAVLKDQLAQLSGSVEQLHHVAKRESDQEMGLLKEQLAQLGEQVEQLQGKALKNSTNSSIPPSQDPLSAPKKTKSLRQKSGKKPGGQKGHPGHHRPWKEQPDKIVEIQDHTCEACGASLEEIVGSIGEVGQEVDIPPITPITTEYRSIIKICSCGHTSCPQLPVAATVTIGPQMSAFITYLNVAHALPYDRLSQITTDLLGFPLSEGTIANKLQKMAMHCTDLVAKIKQKVVKAHWVGGDETGTHVAGKTFWEWVWQSDEASYFVIDQSRGYQVVKTYFTESYQGVLIHDCWSAQNNTPAGAHQVCHAHLLRNLQFAIDKEKSVYAAEVANLLRESQRERDKLWAAEVSARARAQRIQYYRDTLDTLNKTAVAGKEEKKLQKRFIKHRDWIFTFLDYPDVPPDNNSSERAVRAAKVKDKVSGGFRSLAGATRFAKLLTVVHTLRKQCLPLLSSLAAIFRGVDISASLAL